MFNFNKKGKTGLEILLTVVAMLFIIGLIVMIFVIATSNLSNNDIVSEDVSRSTSQNSTLVTVSGNTLTICSNNNGGISSINEVTDSECGS